MQLMSRRRPNEIADARWLEAVEEEPRLQHAEDPAAHWRGSATQPSQVPHGLTHGHPWQDRRDLMSPVGYTLGSWSSYRTRMFGLGLFLAASCVGFYLVCFQGPPRSDEVSASPVRSSWQIGITGVPEQTHRASGADNGATASPLQVRRVA